LEEITDIPFFLGNFINKTTNIKFEISNRFFEKVDLLDQICRTISKKHTGWTRHLGRYDGRD